MATYAIIAYPNIDTMNNAILNTQYSEFPKFYTVKITSVTGVEDSFDAVGHWYQANGMLEIRLTNDTYVTLTIQNIYKCQFDKNFTKIVEEQKRLEAAKSNDG